MTPPYVCDLDDGPCPYAEHTSGPTGLYTSMDPNETIVTFAGRDVATIGVPMDEVVSCLDVALSASIAIGFVVAVLVVRLAVRS